MKIEGYMVLQAEAGIFKGLKGSGNDDAVAYIYPTKQSAHDFLVKLVAQIKHEQSIGWRTKTNLDAKALGGLDFLVEHVIVEVPTGNMKKRNWKF